MTKYTDTTAIINIIGNIYKNPSLLEDERYKLQQELASPEAKRTTEAKVYIYKVKDKNGLFNLVRASTREISFFKDLAFAIDKAKTDAVYMASDSNNAKMFKVLERRASKNKFSRLIRKNDASPITSLVLSQYEVEYLKQLNIDMEKSYNTRSVLEGYNLMDIVVADESLEIAKFLFDDGDGVFETLTFDALEKQANDNTYKKVVNLVSKINR